MAQQKKQQALHIAFLPNQSFAWVLAIWIAYWARPDGRVVTGIYPPAAGRLRKSSVVFAMQAVGRRDPALVGTRAKLGYLLIAKHAFLLTLQFRRGRFSHFLVLAARAFLADVRSALLSNRQGPLSLETGRHLCALVAVRTSFG
jgi:hypothetical protein